MLQWKCMKISTGKERKRMKAFKSKVYGLILVMAAALTGCGENSDTVQQTEAAGGRSEAAQGTESDLAESGSSDMMEGSESENPQNGENGSEETAESQEAAELTVRFGDDGEPFILHLYDNDTAAAIARHVGTADWRLPIYNYEGYENWEVMQYYDVPSRYEIPSNPEAVTTEAAGAVYYSEPNRIILFYGDAEVSGEYTPVGYFDNTEEFRSAVENNPVLEGWDTKMVNISK